MKKEKRQIVLLIVLLLALCFAASGCKARTGAESAQTPAATSTPEPVTGAAPTVTQQPQETVIAAVTPTPPSTVPDVTATPEATKAPISVEIRYEGQAAGTLSFQTGTVFQLQGAASDGSSGGFWTSSDASSASVDENGVVTCWKAGTPKITYTLGDASASCSLQITEPTVRICFGGVDKYDISLSNMWGFEIQLQAVVTPEGSPVTWSSDDPSVASVSDTGYVTGHKMGSTNIVCKCGTAKATCIIRILSNPPTYLQPTPDPDDPTPRIVITYNGVADPDFTITVGQAMDMNYILYNIDPSTPVVWSVGDPGYASVDANGVIVGLRSTFGISALRNYTTLKVTCGEYSYESTVFIKEAQG